MRRCFVLALIAGCTVTALSGCNRGGSKGAPTDLPVLPIAHPEEKDVTDYVDYTGRTQAKDAVTVTARVTGYLVGMPFKEGDDVNVGDTLFEIDPRPYKAQLKAAQAQVEQNIAGLKFAKINYRRFKDLKEKDPGAVSDLQLDQFEAQEKQAEAMLDLAKANLKAAELNLEWTKYTSPINGHISRYYLTMGNLVNQDVTQLTTVVSMEQMYVYFDMDEPTLQQIKRAVNEGRIARPRTSEETIEEFAAGTFGLLATPAAHGSLLLGSLLYPGRTGADVEVFVGLQGETGFPHRGTVNFVDNQVNPGTGSILVRGLFKNPRPPGGTYLMVPGMFVRVRFPIGQPQHSLLVDDRAVVSEQGQKKLYVLDANNKVKDLPVSLGSLQSNGWRVITSPNLKKDDWVLIGGLQQVRPGQTIPADKLERWDKMPTLTDPATPAADKSKGNKGGKQ
jgi:membrane fusion protein, multidrug efflux system